MTLSWNEGRTIVQKAIADSSDDTFASQCLNQAQRIVARDRWWPELIKRDFFNTEAAYSTGTVNVTENSTDVAGTGTVFPATVASAKWRFALSVSDPWYEVTTRTSDVAIVLTDNYVQDTATSQTYVVYRPHYSLASDCDSVRQLWIHYAGGSVPLENAATDQRVTDFRHFHSGPGTPTHYINIERDASGYRQILLGPAAPDDVYRVEYVYRKKVTDDTFVANLDESRWHLIVQKALQLAYEPEFYDRSVMAERRYEMMLAREWAASGESETTHVHVGQTRVSNPSANRYLDNLLDYGTVDYP